MQPPEVLKPEMQTILRVLLVLVAATWLKFEKQFCFWHHTDLPPDQYGLKQRYAGGWLVVFKKANYDPIIVFLRKM